MRSRALVHMLRRTLTLLLVLAGTSTVLSCGGSSPPANPQAPVALGEWCSQVTGKMCQLTADRCFNGMAGVVDGCLDTASKGCLAGRDPAMPSGRNAGELHSCLSFLEPLSCPDLGAAMGSGEGAARCSARAPQQ